MPDPWSAVGQIGASVAAGAFNFWQQERANKANVALAQMQNQWNLDQWNRENQYNLPSNQVARLKAAGLNPNLAFANGSMMNEAAPSPELTAGVGTQRPYQIDPLTAAQVAKLNAETSKIDAETKTEDELRQARYQQLTTLTNNLVAQNDEIVARIRNYVHQNALTDKQVELIDQEMGLNRENMDIAWKRLENETNLSNAQVKQLQADVRKKLAEAQVSEREFYEMVHTFALRKSDLANSVNLKAAQIDQAYATARKLGLEADVIEDTAIGHRQLSQEMKDDDFGAWAVFLVSDAISRLGRVFHN